MTLATTVANVRVLVKDTPFTDVTTGYTAASTSIAVARSTEWKKGEIMEDQTAGQQLIVTADGSGGTVTVRGGHNGTTDATIATGVILHKNPRFFYNQISNAISEVVETLWPHIWVETRTTITPSTTADIYNVPTDYEELIDLHQLDTGSTDIVRPTRVFEVPYVATGILAAGKGIGVVGWPRTDVNATLVYRAQATTTTMPGALERIVARGVAAKLLRGEAARNAGNGTAEAQIQVRNDLTTSNFLEEEFNQQVRRYAQQLARKTHVKKYTRPLIVGA